MQSVHYLPNRNFIIYQRYFRTFFTGNCIRVMVCAHYEHLLNTKSAQMAEPGSCSCVQVAVRVRPLSQSEQEQASERCVQVADPKTVLVGGLGGRQFDFDAVFAPESAQSEIYETLVSPLVERFFDGYNVTVFAYGQTGSGKSYSMGNELSADFQQSGRSSEEVRGIIPRVMDEVHAIPAVVHIVNCICSN